MVWQSFFGIAEEKSPKAKEAAENYTFDEFCKFLEDHPSLKKQQFDELLDKFYSIVDVGDDENFSAYPVVRLLIPAHDNRRRLTVKMLYSAIEFSLSNVQIPKYQMADQFSSFVAQHYGGPTSHLSVYEVNFRLKKMVSEPGQRNIIIRECIDQMSPTELRWFFRILFQEISDKACGSATGRGLVNLTTYLHKKADQFFQAGMDLESICNGVFLSVHKNVDLTNAMILGRPVRPMLLSKMGCNVEDLLTVIKHCRRPFLVETKYDGEHFLLHRLDGGKEHKFFSRRGLEHSDETDQNSLGAFALKFHKYFKSSVKDCILDGELVVKDVQTGKIIGKNQECEDGVVFDVKRFKDTVRYKRVFVVFDLLFLNGEEYFQKPLVQRLKALDSSVFQHTDQNFVFISEKREMSKMADFQNFYYDHLKNGEEGVVIKGKNSIYNFGQRAVVNGWFKVKPDYGIRSVIDVVVVGARYENKDFARLRSFEIAALPSNASTTNGQLRYQIIGGVQARLKKHDLERLVRSLNLKSEKRPPWIQGIQSSERVVKYTDAEHLPVVEVKASGVLNNRLHFPVISALRPDKMPDEICTWDDIADYGKKLRSKKRVFEPDGNTGYTVKGKKMRRVILNTSVHYTPKVSNRITILKGKNVFLVPDAKPAQKAQFTNCEKKLREFGAELFKNYSPKVDLAISPNPQGFRTKGVAKKDEVYVVSIDWILRCIDENKVLRWQDAEIIHTPSNPDAFNLLNFDEDEPETKVEDEEIQDEPQLESIAVNTDTKEEEQTEPQDFEEEPEIREPAEQQDVGVEVDQQIEHEESMETDNAAKNEPQNSTGTASTLENNGTLGMEDLEIEQEEERQILAQTQRFDEDEYELPDDLFFGFCFYVPGHKCDNVDPIYKGKIEKCGGSIADNPDSSVTHVFFQEKYDFDKDRLGVAKWLNENQWLSVLTDRKWVDKAILENDRYLDSVPANNLSG
ncbi:DNA ligase IV [Aphelenchoides bicaudatus]|nr:DNA ligase IV [Aphelenchoides bicaudatus]